MRLAPAFDVDEQQPDTSLSQESVRAIHELRTQEHNLLRFYVGFTGRAFHRDLGTSHSLGQPVRTLSRDRLPVTLRLVTISLALGWVLAVALGSFAPQILALAGVSEHSGGRCHSKLFADLRCWATCLASRAR